MHNVTREMLLDGVGVCLRHYKGTEYIVMLVTLDASTQELRVVYKPNGRQYERTPPWDRVLSEFLELIVWPDGIERTRFVKLAGD